MENLVNTLTKEIIITGPYELCYDMLMDISVDSGRTARQLIKHKIYKICKKT